MAPLTGSYIRAHREGKKRGSGREKERDREAECVRVRKVFILKNEILNLPASDPRELQVLCRSISNQPRVLIIKDKTFFKLS